VTAALVLDRVTKRYGGSPPVEALHAASLRIDTGELVGVVGPSGSGKSTLLAVAGTLERPTGGRVVVAGTAVEAMNDRDLSSMRAHHIGFVFQQFCLLPALTTLENVAHGLLYRGARADVRRRAAREALAAVGLSHRETHRPSELSGGECQRVAIARALVGRPSIILADEPTGNVDSTHSAEIMTLLRSLHDRGATIVVVTHNDAIAASLPRVVRLRDGGVVGDRRAE